MWINNLSRMKNCNKSMFTIQRGLCWYQALCGFVFPQMVYPGWIYENITLTLVGKGVAILARWLLESSFGYFWPHVVRCLEILLYENIPIMPICILTFASKSWRPPYTLRKSSSLHCILSSQSPFCGYSMEWADTGKTQTKLTQVDWTGWYLSPLS